MLSLEICQKLKDAGLQWEPKEGDYVRYFDGNLISILTCGDVAFEDLKDCIFAPRLDQLLAEIEKRGYEHHKLEYWRDKPDNHKHWFLLWADGHWQEFKTGTPDDAAAEALLWILQRKEG